jgi:anti-sigma-K factor RskA
MPASIRERIAFWNWVAILSLIVAVLAISIDAEWHRH